MDPELKVDWETDRDLQNPSNAPKTVGKVSNNKVLHMGIQEDFNNSVGWNSGNDSKNLNASGKVQQPSIEKKNTGEHKDGEVKTKKTIGNRLESFLLMFSTEPVQTGIFHNGEQEFKSPIGGFLNIVSLICLFAYCIYAFTKTFQKVNWAVEIQQSENVISDFDGMLVNDFISSLNLTVTYESLDLDYMYMLLFLGDEGQQVFIDYYGCMEDEYDKYDYIYSLYYLSYDESYDDTDDSDNYYYDEDGNAYYVEDYYDISCTLGDMDYCYDIEYEILYYDNSKCSKSSEAILCQSYKNYTYLSLEAYVYQYYFANSSVNVSKVSDGNVNKNTVNKVSLQSRKYWLALEEKSCTVADSIIYASYSIGDHAMESDYKETYNETTGEYEYEQEVLDDYLVMGDMNFTHDDPFMYIYCWYCKQFGLEYDKLITTSEGIKSFYTITEAPFGDAAFYSYVEPMYYVHADNVFKAFHQNDTLYEVSDPVLAEIFYDNVLESREYQDYYGLEEATGSDFKWEFYLARKKTETTAQPDSIWNAFSEIGGIASFLGIIAILIGMINEKLFYRDLRESVLPQKKAEAEGRRGCCSRLRNAIRPSPDEEKMMQEIQNTICFKELYNSTKTYQRLREHSSLFRKMMQEVEQAESEQREREAEGPPV